MYLYVCLFIQILYIHIYTHIDTYIHTYIHTYIKKHILLTYFLHPTYLLLTERAKDRERERERLRACHAPNIRRNLSLSGGSRGGQKESE